MTAYCHLLSLLSATSVLFPLAAMALPVADPTIGTQLVPLAPNSIQIEGGTQVGQNLFHSFASFNIQTGESVFFLSPTDTSQIFSRVTGGSPSDINGVLGTLGADADLFLINPNGIIFGPNASLAVQGSFIATTADGIQFGESGQFGAATTTDGLLAVDPSAFFFSNFGQPGTIQIDQSRLSVPAGEALVLLGGNISIDNGALQADGGRLEMGAIATADIVTFSPDYALSLPETAQRADIQLTNNTSVAFFNATSDQATSIRVYGNNLDLSNNTLLTTGINAGLDLGNRQTGHIQIHATGNVTLADDVTLGSVVLASGKGQSDNIDITAENLLISNSSIAALIGGEGKSGNIVINVNDQLTVVDSDPNANVRSTIQTVIGSEGIGESGDVIISANNIDISNGFLSVSVLGNGQSGDIVVDAQGQVRLTNGIVASSIGPGSVKTGGGNITVSANTLQMFENSAVATDTGGTGDAGNITLTIRENIVISDNASRNTVISSEVGSSGVGNGGDIEMVANSLEILDGGAISTTTNGIGNAGDIKLTIRDNIVIGGDDIEGSWIVSGVGPNGIGNGGNIEIITANLEVLDTGRINSGTIGLGNAGDIKLTIQDNIVINGNDKLRNLISSEVGANGMGDGGNIEINTTRLEVLNGGQIISVTEGVGDAGNISINASEFVIFDGAQAVGEGIASSGAFSSVEEGAQGDGGNVFISTDRLEITDGAQLNVSTFSNGLAGDIVIEANDSVQLSRGDILAESLSDSPAGNIMITAEQLSIENLSQLSTATASPVNGGNINLTLARLLLLRDRSDITAQAGTAGVGGDGGNINIIAPFIIAIPTEDSDIQANAFEGNGGQINITVRGVFGIEPRPGLTPLSDITASSEGGVSGIIIINTLDTSFIQNNVTDLPEQFLDPDTLSENTCVARAQGNLSTFTLTGHNLANSPNRSTSSTYPTGIVQPLNQFNTIATDWQPGDNTQEPSGIYQLTDGRLIMGQKCS